MTDFPLSPDLAADLSAAPPTAAEEGEILRTRKAWKKLHRRILPGVTPAQTVIIEGTPHHHYSKAQTLTEEEFLLTQRDKITGLCQQWEKNWHHLTGQLAHWHDELSQVDAPTAEFNFSELLRQRAPLLEQYKTLANSARTLEIPLLQPDESAWRDALQRYRQHRWLNLLRDGSQEVSPLAEEVHDRLLRQERENHDPFHLLPYWRLFSLFMKQVEALRLEREFANATRIHEYHALFSARFIQRHFTLYLGPTNSGKTFQALQRLANVPHGIYLAPLRLLALEVAETLNQWGVPCNMITGEERILVEGARHSACTVEMLPLDTHYDLCVIDEAQMLGDSDRGWAWTQAILGVEADEVCVLGAPEARPAVEKLLKLTRDPWEVVELERLSPLQLMDRPVKNFQELEPGTAIIAFSRAGVLGLKDEIERKTGKRSAVLYGALPPEVRRQQAHLFNSGEAPYLASTDAIGMGLNLPIKTILFAQENKIIDRQEVPLTPTAVRQIAGRAGRFGKNEIGYVGTFRIPLQTIRTAFLRSPPLIRRAHLAPNLAQLLAIADLREREQASLANLLTLFIRNVQPDPEVYQLADLEDQTVLARIADRYRELDLTTRFHLSAAPVPLRAIQAVSAYTLMVESVAKNRTLTLPHLLAAIGLLEDARLGQLEVTMQVVNLYSWLHYRFSNHFPDLDHAQLRRREINRQINDLLGRTRKPGNYCASCDGPLPPKHEFKVCEPCWQSRRQKSFGRRFPR